MKSRFLQIAVALATATTLAACGNGATFRRGTKPTKTGANGGNTGSYYFNNNLQNCSAQNIVPDYDRHLDGSGYYVGCWTSSTQLRLQGHPHYGTYVCAIPSLVQSGQYYNTAAFWYLQGSEQIYYTCGQVVNDQVTLNLSDLGTTPPNAVFIVESSFISQAVQVLSPQNRNYALMPEFSYGFPGNL